MMRLSKRNGSYNTMRSSVEAATVLLALVLITSGTVLAGNGNGAGSVEGKKFIINNITPFDGTPPCPDANPNTVAFQPGPHKGLVQNGTVVVVGNFDGAGFGVCANAFYGVDPSLTITYEIWGDWIVYRIPDRVHSASKVVPIKNALAFIANGQNFPVSILTVAK